jgi:hypothetical protein
MFAKSKMAAVTVLLTEIGLPVLAVKARRYTE